MCPLRFILVFFSAVLAGYFAWRTARSSPEVETTVSDDSTIEKKPLQDNNIITNQEFNVTKIIRNGFWVFVDMASGKYLWRILKEMRKDEKVKKSC